MSVSCDTKCFDVTWLICCSFKERYSGASRVPLLQESVADISDDPEPFTG